MKLLHLKAKNLFSIGEAEINLANRGLVLVTGYSQDEGSANGSGKSTLANKAILWTLFGRTAGGLKGDDVVNRYFPKAKCEGVIQFRDFHCNYYEVIRTRNPASLKFRYLSKEEDWTDLSRRNQNDTQELINNTLGRDLTTFLQTDFFGQGRDKSFLSLTPAQQVEVLEQILPIDELTKWSKHAKESSKKLKEKLDNLFGEVSRWNGALAEVLSTLSGLEAQSSNFNTQKLQRVASLRKKLGEYEASVANKNKKLEELKEEFANLPEVNLTESNDKLEGAEAELKSATTEIDKCAKAEHEIQMQLRFKKSEVSDVNENCPTCKQLLPQEVRTELLNKQKQVLEEVKILEEQLVAAQSVQAQWVEYATPLEDMYNIAKESHNDIVASFSRKNSLITQISSLEKEINTAEKTKIETELKEAENSTNPYGKAINGQKTRKQESETVIEKLQKETKDLEEEISHLTFWSETFGKDFKTFLFRRACPFLQSRTSAHLTGLGNSQLKVEFNTSKELKSGDERLGFNVNAYSETGGQGFDSLSGGEQQIVSFAVGLALADLAETQVQGASHFLILDEPFMALDERNCENLVTYLTNELSSKRETILLISNEDNLKSLIPERVHVEKRNGVTSISNA